IVGWKFEPFEAWIAHAAQIGGGQRVAADPEKVQRAALKAVGRLLAAAAYLDEVIAIARGFQDSELFRDRSVGQRIAACVEQCEQLLLARVGNRDCGHERFERRTRADSAPAKGI